MRKRVVCEGKLALLAWAQASLKKLNEVLGEGQAVPMERFRPNLVLSETEAPFAEDAWDTFTAKGPSHSPCKFRAVMPCDRCKVTTTDQSTLKVGKEPLHTLGTFRGLQHLDFIPKERFPSHAVFFGWLCVPVGRGTVKVGDTVVPAHRDGPLL
jgi:uncharacterized protein YcbX